MERGERINCHVLVFDGFHVYAKWSRRQREAEMGETGRAESILRSENAKQSTKRAVGLEVYIYRVLAGLG